MKLYIVDDTFIAKTLAETFIYGFGSNPRKSYAIIQHLRKHIPKRDVNFESNLIKMLHKFLGPFDSLAQPYYYSTCLLPR